MGLLSWIILGAIAGFLAYRIMGGEGQGCLINTVMGIIGAVIGGWIFDVLHIGGPSYRNFNLYGLVVAVVGAIVVIAVARALGGKN